MPNMTSKVIVALDFNRQSDALQLVEQLTPHQCRLKVGKEMFTQLGPDFVKLLVDKGFDVFLDLKFHDIPNTVKGAIEKVAELGVWMVNVHAMGGIHMLKAARDAIDNLNIEGKKPLLIGVTLLTSLAEKDLVDLGMSGSIESNVMRLAALCKQANLDGVVCSALEAKSLKNEFGKDFICVTPGIRLTEDANCDQKRVMTPRAALKNGADYLVVGRSITQTDMPKAVLQQINAELEVI